MSDRNALARLTWAAPVDTSLCCEGCRRWMDPGDRWLSVVIDVASFEFIGVLCGACGERLEKELGREQDTAQEAPRRPFRVTLDLRA